MSLQYIIDGYNIINHPLFTLGHNKKIQDCRIAFLELIRVKRLCGSSKNQIIVVFDSYPPVPGLKQNYVNVDIIFSRDETADEKIKKMVEKSSRPRNIVVVSDDKEIKLFVKSVGARVLGAEEFINRQEKQRNLKDEETAMSALKPELNYSEILKINRELKKIWLK